MIELDFALPKRDETMILLSTREERPVRTDNNGNSGELESLSDDENSAEKREFISDLLSPSGSRSWIPGGDMERGEGINGNAVVKMDWAPAPGCVCIADRGDFRGVEVYCTPDWI